MKFEWLSVFAYLNLKKKYILIRSIVGAEYNFHGLSPYFKEIFAFFSGE